MKHLSFYIIFCMAMIIHACSSPESSSDQGKIITVTGVIDPAQLGTTLTHEHLLVDFIGADSTGYHRWNRDTVVEVVAPYLEEIGNLGVHSFVECTPAYLGRDPLLLKRLSEQTGIRILTNTGYYGARSNKFIPGEPGGGNFRGFTDIYTMLIPALGEAGFTGEEIDQLLVANPAEAFAIR